MDFIERARNLINPLLDKMRENNVESVKTDNISLHLNRPLFDKGYLIKLVHNFEELSNKLDNILWTQDREAEDADLKISYYELVKTMKAKGITGLKWGSYVFTTSSPCDDQFRRLHNKIKARLDD
jgi:hypothetical protein